MVPIRNIHLFLLLTWVSPSGADVVFKDLDGEQEANARALMPLASATCDSARWRVERLFRDADRNLTAALRALGYYDLAIAKSMERGADCWRATFDVQVGAPVRMRTVDVRVEGAASADASFRKLIQANRPAVGDILNHGRYEQLKSHVLQAALKHGYFDAAFTSNEVTVDPEARAADLVLHLQSGPRYRFGELAFSGGVINDSILRA